MEECNVSIPLCVLFTGIFEMFVVVILFSKVAASLVFLAVF